MEFLLGTHEPTWLARSFVPLFVSAVRLRRRGKGPRAKPLPRARSLWALDSGGFSELSLRGRWTVTPERYAAEVRVWRDAIGQLKWAAIQDWMCEPPILAKTGKTVREHQTLTIASLLRLRQLAPEVAWCPVVQGWTVPEYLDHVQQYADAGVDLRAEPIVGVGSVCRRQATREGAAIMHAVAGRGLRVHAFGVKTQGLKLFGDTIASADSMAWSYVARKRPIRLPGHTHVTCSNCYRWAMQWREALVAQLGPTQREMPW